MKKVHPWKAKDLVINGGGGDGWGGKGGREHVIGKCDCMFLPSWEMEYMCS